MVTTPLFSLLLSLGSRSNRQVMCPRPAPATPLSQLARLIICMVDLKSLKNSMTRKTCSPRATSTRCASSTTRLSSGRSSSALEMSPSAVPSTPHARSKRTRCLSSEGATPPTSATTTPTTSNYVTIYLLSRIPMVPTTQSEVCRPSQKRNEQNWRP